VRISCAMHQLRLYEYPDCVKNIQEVNESVYTVPGSVFVDPTLLQCIGS